MSDEPKKQTEMFPEEEIIEGTLVPGPVAQTLKTDESKGRYTAVRLKKLYPWKYNAIVAMLGAGVSMRHIADTIGVNFALVASVNNIDPGIVAKAKEKFTALSNTNSIIAAEALQQMLVNLKQTELDNPTVDQIYKLALASGNIAEKASAIGAGITPPGSININVQFNGSWQDYRDKHLKKEPKTITLNPEGKPDADPAV